MKKEHVKLLDTQAKVYFANKSNEDKLKNINLKAYSDDEDFIIVYSQEDIQNIQNMYRFMDYHDYQLKQSLEDEVYDNFIREYNIEIDEFKNWLFIVKKIDKSIQIPVKFDINGLKFTALLNKKDSLKDGSDVIFGLSSDDDSHSTFLTVSTEQEQ